jgi:cation:H+ antiporter
MTAPSVSPVRVMVGPDTGTLLALAAGTAALAGLVKAAAIAVDRLLALARHYGLPEVVIGLFVLSVGTSLPEIGTHLIASVGILSGSLDYRVASGTVIGANMGSSTAQQLLLFGLLFVGFGRYTLTRTVLRRSYLPMLAVFLLLFVVAFDGTISRPDGVVLLLAVGAYAYHSFTRTARAPVLPAGAESRRVGRDALVAVGALAAVLASAFVVLSAVEAVVADLGLSGSMLGVLTIGIASALPELSTVLESIRRKTPSLAVGTLVGSNVVNLLVALGLGSAISTYAVPASVLLWDLPFKLAVGVGLLAYLRVFRDDTIARRDGFTLVVLYLVYVVGRLILFPG